MSLQFRGGNYVQVLGKNLVVKVESTGICTNCFCWKPIYIGEVRCDTQGK